MTNAPFAIVAPLVGAFDFFGNALWVSNWLTPLWLIGVGALLGLAVLLLLWPIAWLLRKVPVFGRLAEVPLTISEGPLQLIFGVVVALAVFGVLGLFVVRRPAEMIDALLRLPQLGVHTATFEIAAPPADDVAAEQAIEVSFRRNEIYSLQLSADEPLTVSAFAQDDPGLPTNFNVKPGEVFEWNRATRSGSPFPKEVIDELFVLNQGTEPTKLVVTIDTRLAYPQIWTAVYAALAVIGVYLLYALQRSLMPRISAVALSTYKSETAQPLFLILMALGLFGVIIFEFIPYNTFGEDIKMLKMSGLTLIMIFAIVQAVWAASTSISEEVEGRTALTVLSKPITRRDFIIGKYLGILWTVAVMFAILGTVFLAVVAYKPIYDARETSKDDPTWQQCHDEMTGIVPGLALSFMETGVIAAISVAISTRLPMLANFVISFAIYVLGHLTPLLVQSKANEFEIVRFFGRFISTIFPVLEYYDIQAGIAGGAPVPLVYLGWMLLYTMLYIAIALFLALILFEDRDLA
jgi:ABC-type transport system involved in multi-copper enzyme maturation permease subunit